MTIGALAGALFLAGAPVQASTITFDEFAASNNNAALGAQYASLGVTFLGDNSGTWSGLSQGDPGNWGIEGTSVSSFLGNNGFGNHSSYVTTIVFASGMEGASFDIARSNGSRAGQTVVASAFDGLTLLGSQSILLGAINNWSTIAFGMGGIRSLVITGSTGGFSPYGIDNLRFNEPGDETPGQVEVTAIPEPGTYAMMLAGLGLLGFTARRRKHRASGAI